MERFGSVGNFVYIEQCRSIFPRLVPLVSDRLVRHNGKHQITNLLVFTGASILEFDFISAKVLNNCLMFLSKFIRCLNIAFFVAGTGKKAIQRATQHLSFLLLRH